MTRTAWFNCSAGAAGDMILAALVDAGADLAAVEETCRSLGVAGWSLRTDRVARGAVTGTHVVVDAEPSHTHRPWLDVRRIVLDAGLPERVTARALAVFERLAEAEGRVHGLPPDEVEFHEVGAVDSIVDVVGACVALELLGIDRVAANAVVLGTGGTVRSAHGLLPNPPPAVMILTEGAPVVGIDVARELTTPTGAALLVALVEHWGAVPAMSVRSIGIGAGTRDPADRPNVLTVTIGDDAAGAAPEAGRPAAVSHPPHAPRTVGSASSHPAGPAGPSEPAGPSDHVGARVDPLLLVESNIDDQTGEVLGHTVAALLDAGAVDAWIVPVTGKKGRPAHVVSALADGDHVDAVRDRLVAETGTLGVRVTPCERWARRRSRGEVLVEGGAVGIKYADGWAKPEHDDVVAVSEATGRPVREVAAAALEQWRRSAASEPPS
ncbi:MAG: nickel pincer cofactor biosynthesis protein LarC [Actinomycetota bacterium]|nr:nickel pincer cofactor biosynthesis protein LarC [Actinomycetota bacterium]